MSAAHQIPRDNYILGVTPVCKQCKYITATSFVHGGLAHSPALTAGEMWLTHV